LLLDRLDNFGDERPRHDEVVEKTLVGRRTDTALHARKHVRDRRREQVRRAVTIEGEVPPLRSST
jgi:hypothetical protein